jgi:DNA replication and repair protein RecF
VTGRVVFEQVSVDGFRNIEHLAIEPVAGRNLISGENGQGKTSLLEALYVVATTKSFRTNWLREVVREGEARAVVAARVASRGESRTLRTALSQRGRSWLVDGKRPERLAEYALDHPVVVFHPGDLDLVGGSAEGRRTLLDRIALFNDPVSLDALRQYRRALKSRQRVLEERGERAPELEAIEAVAARHGARVARGREECAALVEPRTVEVFTNMGPSDLELSVRYEAGGTLEEAEFRRELGTRRGLDLRRRSASFGPQRDDLVITLDGMPSRSHSSQGQQRLITLALKLAELGCVSEATRLKPVLLLDDVSSELDEERTQAVFEYLRGAEGQVFVTTTRPELFATAHQASERADFRLVEGKLTG